MIEKKNGSLKTIVGLGDKEAIRFVLDALTRSYIGDVPEPKEQKEKSILEPKLDFRLEEVGPNEYLSPVFGQRNKEAV